MKKVLILGSAGMLGHMVYHYFKGLNDYSIIDASFPFKLHNKSIILDVRNENTLKNLIIDSNPDFVINCIGVLIKGSKENPANAIYLNSYFPHSIVNILDNTEGKLIHISTDCVFSGSKGSYVETDFRDADDIYGRSKALGEVIHKRHLTLRTSIIGPELKENGEGLFDWFMKQNEEVNGFNNAIWSGVTTLELAKVIKQSIEQDLTGLYHVTNGIPISKFELLSLINNVFKRGIKINSVYGKKVNKSFIDTRKELDYKVKDYNQMIVEMSAFIRRNKYPYKAKYQF